MKNGKRILRCGALFLGSAAFLLLLLRAARPAEPAVPAFSPAGEEATLWVDGSAVTGVFRGGRHYADAEAFLAALDADFWRGEKEDLRRSLGGARTLCAEDFCEAQGIALYGEGGAELWCSSAAGDWELPPGVRVPVLMYHGVGDDCWTSPTLFTSPDDLRAQLAWLLDNGFTPIFFEDLKHADAIEKPVLLTFDDSFRDNYTELFPILKEYGVKATLFVIQGTVGWDANLSAAQLREMLASGLVRAECHTQYHYFLDELSDEQLIEELCWSKAALTKLTGRIPCAIAYPAGREDARAVAICRREYRFGVKMGGPVYVTGEDPFFVHRIAVPRGISLGEFAARLLAAAG